MPWSKHALAFFGLCSTAKGRAKATKKCPDQAFAKRALKEQRRLSGRGRVPKP